MELAVVQKFSGIPVPTTSSSSNKSLGHKEIQYVDKVQQIPYWERVYFLFLFIILESFLGVLKLILVLL